MIEGTHSITFVLALARHVCGGNYGRLWGFVCVCVFPCLLDHHRLHITTVGSPIADSQGSLLAMAQIVKTCRDCTEEFITNAEWKQRCLKCFQKNQDSGRGRDASRSPRRLSGTVWKTGKHMGRTFEEVEVEDPEYVRWALSLENPTRQVAGFVAWLRGAPSPFRKLPEAPKEPDAPQAHAVHLSLTSTRHLSLEERKVLFTKHLLAFPPDKNTAHCAPGCFMYLRDAKTWYLGP